MRAVDIVQELLVRWGWPNEHTKT